MLFLVLSNAKAYVTIGWGFNELGFHPAIKGKVSHSWSVNVDFLMSGVFQEVFVTIYFLCDGAEKFHFAL
ncbi:hypothetical protein C6382_17375 [Pseudomonas sp. BBP2017]|nr:hypothetical protein C6382_17375 [Pseudomonas sp. BBP2017]